MEITPRDVLYLVTILGSVGGLYVGIVVRLTRLEGRIEALLQRLETAEKTIDELQASDSDTQAALASLSSGALRGRRVTG